MARLLADLDATRRAIGDAPARRGDPWPARSGHRSPLPPVTRPGKIIAVGRNYHEHAAEEGQTAPADPVLFAKFPTASSATGPTIVWRAADTAQVDYEAELAVVIGRTARDVPAERALDHVLGYTCLNDVSARDLQFGDGQWVRGKSLDTFCPMGPWIVTADELPDPGTCAIRCLVNGEVVQDAGHSEMVHDVPAPDRLLLAVHDPRAGRRHRDRDAGRGRGLPQPPRFLGDGDEVVVDIDGIGRLINRCRVIAG